MIFSVLKSNLFIRALLLDSILVTEKTTRTPRVHLVKCQYKDVHDSRNNDKQVCYASFLVAHHVHTY